MLDFIKNEQNRVMLESYCNRIYELGLSINDETFNLYNELDFDSLKNILNNNIQSIESITKKGKSKDFIQGFLDSNFYTVYEFLPSYIKEDKELLKAIVDKFKLANTTNKLNIINMLSSLNSKKDFSLRDKEKILEICLNEAAFIQNKKLQMVLKGVPLVGLVTLQNDLNKRKTKSEKEAYLNVKLEEKRKDLERLEIAKSIEKREELEVSSKEYQIYNKEYYDFIKDEKLSNDKIDVIKYAYFQNGLNLDDLKNDLGNDLYSCNIDQLKNYVDTYTRFVDGYLTKNEYEFSKEIIEENHITQEEIKDVVLPTIEKYDLTERQIKECVDIGAHRQKGDCEKFIKLALTAKENKFSNFEINEIIDDSKEKNTRNAVFKKDLIKEYGKCNLTEIDKLNEYTDKQMEILLIQREYALELKGLKEFEVEKVGLEF